MFGLNTLTFWKQAPGDAVAVRRTRSAGRSRPPRRVSLEVEALEKRELLSANLAPALANLAPAVVSNPNPGQPPVPPGSVQNSIAEPLALLNNYNQFYGRTVQAVSSAMDGQGNLYDFAIDGINNSVLYQEQSSNGNWNGWNSLGGYVTSIKAIANANGEMNLFAIGGGGALYWNSASPSGVWSGWTDLGGYVRSITAALDPFKDLDVFGIGGDDAVYYRAQNPTTNAWSTWTDLGGDVKPVSGDLDKDGALTTSLDAHGNLDVFAIGTNNAAFYRSQSSFYGTWSAWQGIGGSVLSISAVLSTNSGLEVFGDTTSLQAAYASLSSGTGTWSAWTNLGENENVTEPEWLTVQAAVDPHGDTFVYALGTDGSVRYQEANSVGYWGTSWMSPGGNAKAISLTEDTRRGQVDLAVVGSNNAMFSLEGATYQPASGTLFGSGGPSYLDVQQSSLADCWLDAGLAEVAARDPSIITNMFTYEGTATNGGATVGLYKVRFYNALGTAVYVQVDTDLPTTGQYDAQINGVFWPALAEKAYVEATAAGFVESQHSGIDNYDALSFGDAAWSLQAITGKQACGTGSGGINTTAIANAWNQGEFIVLNTNSPNNSSLVQDHVYALVGYNASSNQPFELFNPWGSTATNLSVSVGSTSTGTATVHGYVPTYDGSYYGLFNADATFLKNYFYNDSLTSGAAAMTPERAMTKLAYASSAVTRTHPVDAVFSTTEGHSIANRTQFDHSADWLALAAAGSADRVSAMDVAFLRTVHEGITAGDPLVTDYSSN